MAKCNALDERFGPRPPAAPQHVRDDLRAVEIVVGSRAALVRPYGWVLRHHAGVSYGEIASADGVTEETVKSTVCDLRRSLREVLRDASDPKASVLHVAARCVPSQP